MMKMQTKLGGVVLLVIVSMIASTHVDIVEAQTSSAFWSKQIGSAGDDNAQFVASDHHGNIYVSGTTEGNLFSMYSGIAEIFLSKYDSAGNLLWSKQFGSGNGEDSPEIAVDSQDNVYVAGGTNGTLFATNAGGEDFFLVKYDSSGNQIWATQYGVGGMNVADGVATDASGNIFIIGYTDAGLFGQNADASTPNSQAKDAFIAKYDSSGNRLWGKQFGALGDDMPVSIAVDIQGNAVVVGDTRQLFSGNLGDTDGFLAKFGNDGTLLWGKQFGTNQGDDLSSVRIDSSNNIYVAGAMGETDNSIGYGFAGKYDASGNQLWSVILNSGTDDTCVGIVLDGQNNVYVVGNTIGNLFAPNAGDSDAFIAKYDNNGNNIWGKQYGTSFQDEADSVCVDSQGFVDVVGTTAGSLFGANAGNNDVFIQKLSPSGQMALAKPRHSPPYKRLLFAWAGQRLTLTYPPVLTNKQPYVYAGYLCSGIPGAKVSRTAAKQMVIEGRGKQVVITPNTLAYQINGKTRKMSAKPVMVNNDCYVPLDVMKAVLPYPVRYDVKAQTVRFDPPQKKVARN